MHRTKCSKTKNTKEVPPKSIIDRLEHLGYRSHLLVCISFATYNNICAGIELLAASGTSR